MKRITTLFLAVSLFFGASTDIARATDFKINGLYTISGQGADSLNFLNSAGNNISNEKSPNGFNVYQRVQVGLSMIASESLSGHLVMRMPNRAVWGADGFSVGSTNNSSLINIHHAYLDWLVPDSEVAIRMGLQDFTLPGYLGGPANPVIDSSAPGVSISIPFYDHFDITAQWFRLEADEFAPNSNYDVFNLMMPIHYDDFSITPWASYGIEGKAVSANNINTDTYWFGVTSEFHFFDPLTFGVDALYSTKNTNYNLRQSATGWMIDAYLSYATDYGTPALFGWYATGDGHENGRRDENRISQMDDQGSWGYGNWISGQSAFFVQDDNELLSNSGVSSPAGTWAIGLNYTGLELMDKLTLGAHAMYITGTNNRHNAPLVGGFTPSYLTTEDNITELAAYATYEMYKELQTALEINYMIQDIDKDTWLASGSNVDFENAFRAALTFQYTF